MSLTLTQHEHSSQTFTPGYTRHAWRAPTASWQSATVLARNNVSLWLCLLVDRTEGERRARHALILRAKEQKPAR